MSSTLAMSALLLTASLSLGACHELAPFESGDAGARADKPDSNGATPVLVDRFEAPAAIDAVNSLLSDDDPTVSSDLRELYFNRGDDGIWRSQRASTAQQWGPPTRVDVLSTTPNSTTPALVDDSTMYLAHEAGPGQPNDIAVARRVGNGPWAAPAIVAELASPAGECCPMTTPDALIAIFASDRDSPNGIDDLYQSRRRAADMPWGQPVRLAISAPDVNDGGPWLDASGTVLLLATRRDDGVGGHDIYISRRASRDDAFSTPTLLPDVNSVADEDDPWLASDGSLYFASERAGTFDIYVARPRRE